MTNTFKGKDVKISLPEDVKFIIKTIKEAGYEAYAVGGCIRDSLLGKKPSDYDITTSADPVTVKGLFRRTIDTGIQHGTVTVMLKSNGYEVTTYRIDGVYEDNRHPKEVSFTSSLREDLLRRDFTINAMAYNDEDGLVDLFDGQQDMSDGIIRCVGVPHERFSEDALRIMRAVRFSAQLGYEIEESTREAMALLAPNLKDVSAERIQVELVKLMCSNHPDKLRDAYELGLTNVFLPEFNRMMETTQNNPHHCYTVGEHTIKAICEVENDKYLRLTMLFHDMGKPYVKTTDENGIDHFHGHAKLSCEMSKEVLRRLKFDNDTIKTVSKLSLLHDDNIDISKKAVRRAANRIGVELFPMLLKVRKADTLAQSMYKREEKLNVLSKVSEIYEEILRDNDCMTLKDLNINGSDLIELGYQKGPMLGEELNRILEKVLDEPNLNTTETLRKIAKEDLE